MSLHEEQSKGDRKYGARRIFELDLITLVILACDVYKVNNYLSGSHYSLEIPRR